MALLTSVGRWAAALGALVALGLVAPVVIHSQPAAATVEGLLARFRAAPGFHARFREEKHITLLSAPLVSEGTIDFAPPARLVRHTARPRRSTLLIDGDRLRLGDAFGYQELDLASQPALRSLVGVFVQLLRGNRSALERAYHLEFEAGEPAGAGWRLRLRPRSAPLTRLVEAISVRGHGVALTTLTVTEPNGDSAVTTFTDVDAERRHSPADLRRIFRLPPR